MKASRLLAAITSAAAASFLSAESVKDREGAVRKDKAAMEDNARWIYNDVPGGFAEAKRAGKPLLVTLRGVVSIRSNWRSTSVSSASMAGMPPRKTLASKRTM